VGLVILPLLATHFLRWDKESSHYTGTLTLCPMERLLAGTEIGSMPSHRTRLMHG